jgi:hypothetical protein
MVYFFDGYSYGHWNIYGNAHFDVYMGEIYNTTSITRDWLQGVLEEQLFLSQRGIHLVSDPGHGKTSIISQLVCAKPSSLWYKKIPKGNQKP